MTALPFTAATGVAPFPFARGAALTGLEFFAGEAFADGFTPVTFATSFPIADNPLDFLSAVLGAFLGVLPFFATDLVETFLSEAFALEANFLDGVLDLFFDMYANALSLCYLREVPRAKNTVKVKPTTKPLFYSKGAVDLHFHGAFGIDLMSCTQKQLTELSHHLWVDGGVAAFCPTTLSADKLTLKNSVKNLGIWIRNNSNTNSGAIPLGIHLEGPFIAQGALGAHPKGVIRPLHLNELDDLWLESQHTIKLITLAPETLKNDHLIKVSKWALKRKIKLNIGHTQCTYQQARFAFDHGFSGVTHAWNAMKTHHREPGVLGAAFGEKNIFVEIIPDGIHISDTHINWALKLHKDGVVFVSDATPAAGLPFYQKCSFGDLVVHNTPQGCQIAEGKHQGTLAGGGLMLPQMLANWACRCSTNPVKYLKNYWFYASNTPIQALGVSGQKKSAILKNYKIAWRKTKTNGLYPTPLPLKKLKTS